MFLKVTGSYVFNELFHRYAEDHIVLKGKVKGLIRKTEWYSVLK